VAASAMRRAHRALFALRRQRRRADAAPALATRSTSDRSGRASNAAYAEIIDPLPDANSRRRIFCSITRKTFGTVGRRPGRRILRARPRSARQRHHARRNQGLRQSRGRWSCSSRNCWRTSAFRAPYRDFELSVKRVSDELKASLESGASNGAPSRKLELIKEVFLPDDARLSSSGASSAAAWHAAFRRRAAQPRQRVVVDAIMLDESRVSVLFSFTRSYFHVDLAHVARSSSS